MSMYLLRCYGWNSVSTALLMRVRHDIVSYTRAIVVRLYEASEGDENTPLRRGFTGPPSCARKHEKQKKPKEHMSGSCSTPDLYAFLLRGLRDTAGALELKRRQERD